MPIWRDVNLDITTKILATLTIIGVTFWMGRASITVSGGFNCMASFVMLGLAWALLLLPNMNAPLPQWYRKTILVICAGYVASFSFGTGLAIWPCLLFLGWCLRLPWRSLGAIVVGGLSAGLIFHFLPPQGAASLMPAGASIGPLCVETLHDFCRLLGAPVLYCTTAWRGTKITTAMTQSSSWLLSSGAAGLLLAVAVAAVYLIRRDLQAKTLESIGLGLIIFNLASLLLVVVGRLEYFREIPGQIVASRYWFWSSLFWVGLLLVGLGHGTRHNWIRWPSILFVLAVPIVGWQGHRDEGLHWRYAKLMSEQSATGLINGVHDPDRMLFREMKQIDILAPQLRARRLDMFAEGLQDWIGKPVSKLFGGRCNLTYFHGSARAEHLIGGRDQTTAVKVTGQLSVKEHAPQRNMVIVDPTETVVGIARSFHSDRFWNCLIYGNRMSDGPLGGYIRNYNPELHYVLRAVAKNGVSEQTIDIAPLPPSRTQ